MSFFGSIVDKIVHYADSVLEPEAKAASPASASPEAAAPVPASPAPGASAPLASVDVGAVLAKLDAEKGGGLNYQTSIVDLLKLLDLDSSLAARRTLAGELDVHVAADGTAEENEALHKAVVAKLAENGGRLPASMTA